MSPAHDRSHTPKLSFPCHFDIKAMGRHDARFEARAQDIVRRHVAPADLLAVHTRMSGQNRYVSVTLTITASSYEQLHAIYQDLSDCEEVLFAL
jgi:uncharacterized protein